MAAETNGAPQTATPEAQEPASTESAPAASKTEPSAEAAAEKPPAAGGTSAAQPQASDKPAAQKPPAADKEPAAAKPEAEKKPAAEKKAAAKPAAKPAAKKKKAKAPAKPFAQAIEEDVIPATVKLFQDRGTNDLSLTLEDTTLAGRFDGGKRAFKIFFSAPELTAPKSITYEIDGIPASTIESFMIDERKVSPELLVLYISQRMYAQQWI